MICSSEEMEMHMAIEAAARICTAMRTAPKACGIDRLHTLVLTDRDKDDLADKMDELAREYNSAFPARDANCIRSSLAVVLVGIQEDQRGLGDICGYCHNANCAACRENGSVCVFDPIDIGIALGSAAATAADLRVDTRILFSAGRAAQKCGLMGENITMIHALPISISGKSPFFDRKPRQ